MLKNYDQTQVDFVNIDKIFYKSLVYSFCDENFDYISQALISTKKNQSQSAPIPTTVRWHNFQNIHEKLTPNNILALLKDNQKQISELRGHPVISYLTAVNTNSTPDQISLDDYDIENFVKLIEDMNDNIDEIDVILHSHGGYIESAHMIIKLLRERFEKVNFLIPFAAHSAASMMCMAADEIIMTPESSLSPFGAQVLSPDDNRTYLSAQIMKKCVKEAKKSKSVFSLLTPKSLYEGWDRKMIYKTRLFCNISIKQSKSYPVYWLMKYMFKFSQYDNPFFTCFPFIPFLKKFTSAGRKANRIVKLFINTGTRLGQNTPIMYHDLKNSGLKVSKADGRLLKLMRETYKLSDTLFECDMAKNYI